MQGLLALRLLNKALLPWQLQPKRRKAVLTNASPKCRDDGHCIEEVEPNQPDDIDGMAWQEASDASEAETDHGLDDEFECRGETSTGKKSMERLVAKTTQMTTDSMKKQSYINSFEPHSCCEGSRKT